MFGVIELKETDAPHPVTLFQQCDLCCCGNNSCVIKYSLYFISLFVFCENWLSLLLT